MSTSLFHWGICPWRLLGFNTSAGSSLSSHTEVRAQRESLLATFFFYTEFSSLLSPLLFILTLHPCWVPGTYLLSSCLFHVAILQCRDTKSQKAFFSAVHHSIMFPEVLTFNLWGVLYTYLCSGCTSLYFHQQCRSISPSPTHTHLPALVTFCAPDSRHSI